MGQRGPKPKDECVNGHDLTDPDNVVIVKRRKSMKFGQRTYKERQCRLCKNKRNRENWAKNGQRYEANRKKAA